MELAQSWCVHSTCIPWFSQCPGLHMPPAHSSVVHSHEGSTCGSQLLYGQQVLVRGAFSLRVDLRARASIAALDLLLEACVHFSFPFAHWRPFRRQRLQFGCPFHGCNCVLIAVSHLRDVPAQDELCSLSLEMLVAQPVLLAAL
eukprot:3610528-Rhodomonas_salina.1